MTESKQQKLQSLLLNAKRNNVPGAKKLSENQKRELVLLSLNQEYPLNLHSSYTINGKLQLSKVRQCVATLIGQQDILRNTFIALADSRVKLVRDTMAVQVSDNPEPLSSGFDLENGPLFDIRVINEGDATRIDIYACRLTFDNPSIDLLANEIIKLYQDSEASTTKYSIKSELLESSSFAQYQQQERDYIDGTEYDDAIAFWRNYLNNVAPLKLPTDFPRPKVKGHHRATCSSTIESRHLDGLAPQLEQYNFDLKQWVLGCFAMILGKNSAAQDFAIGIRCSLRGELYQNVLGPFDNEVTLRFNMKEESRVLDIVKQVGNDLKKITAYTATPVARVIEEISLTRDLSQAPLFQVGFDYNSSEINPQNSHELITKISCVEGNIDVDLSLNCTLTDNGLQLNLCYNKELFEPQTMTRCLDVLSRKILAIDAIESPLNAADLFFKDDSDLVINKWNDTSTTISTTDCIHNLFERQVEIAPENIALVDDDRSLTYVELNEEVNRLSRFILAKGDVKGQRIAICLKHNASFAIAILAVLKSGAAYVPIVPSLPRQRKHYLLENSTPALLITESELMTDFTDADQSTILLDKQCADIFQQSAANPDIDINQQDIAYLIYTSGTTGLPKAVAMPQLGIINNLLFKQRKWLLTSQDSVLQNHSFGFDPSVWALLWPLFSGAKVVLKDPKSTIDTNQLAKYLKENKISVIGGVPSFLGLLADNKVFTQLTDLRLIMSGGEKLDAQTVNKITVSSTATLVNFYGPTETAIDVAHIWCPAGKVDVIAPIGFANDNCQIYVLDNTLNPCPIGIQGEIFVSGFGLASHYHNNLIETAKKFLPNPFHGEGQKMYRTGDLGYYNHQGELEILGRVDEQIKINGYRIELGEIENAIRLNNAIIDVAVLAVDSHNFDKKLVAYAVADATAMADEDMFRQGLLSSLDIQLPDYMVPAKFVFKTVLPTNSNGKVDRPLLEQEADGLFIPDQQYIAPETTAQKDLAVEFEKTLNLTKISIDADFFELGGTSIILARLAPKIMLKFDIDIPIHQLFKVPTIRGVGELVEFAQKNQLDVAIKDQHSVNLRKDSELDFEINLTGLPKANYFDPKDVLLTGGTGYLGAYLIKELMDRTSANVHVLARGKSTEHVYKRLVDNMIDFGIWQPSYAYRLVPLHGDLGSAQLGLSDDQWQSLADNIDCVYHNGALVNFVFPYSALRAANVQGTKELLKLCCQRKIKAFHYVSTIDTILSVHLNRPFIEDATAVDSTVSIPGGYTGSKWVAERTVHLAQEQGLPVSIYRPGLILGHTESGHTQTSDYLVILLKGFLKMGLLPEFARIFDTVPVDYVAKAIVQVSKNPRSHGKFYHLFNPAPVTVYKYYEWIRNFGYQFEVAPSHETRRYVQQVGPDHPLYPLTPLILGATPEDEIAARSLDPIYMNEVQPDLECKNTLEMIAGSDVFCPPMDEQQAIKNIQYLIDIKWLETPDRICDIPKRG